MTHVGVWHITADGLDRLSACGVELEQQLENWIEQNPSLVRGDLTIVGKQLQTGAGPLDLLAIDPQGRWVVIEIKRGTLRRETIAQAVDYASCISCMPADELRRNVNEYLDGRSIDKATRELLEDAIDKEEGEARAVDIIVTGTRRHAGLDRMVDFLTSGGTLAITTVTLDVYEVGQGQRVLLRELTEADTASQPIKPSLTAEQVLSQADKLGTGDICRAIHKVAVSAGLHPRPYKRSIMYTPPQNRSRCLFTVWAKRDHPALISKIGFSEFFGIREDEVEQHLGAVDNWDLHTADVGRFEKGLQSLIEKAEQ